MSQDRSAEWLAGWNQGFDNGYQFAIDHLVAFKVEAPGPNPDMPNDTEHWA